MEVLPLDAPYGMDHVRLRCCCTKCYRICGICDRCETLSASIDALLGSGRKETLEVEKLRLVSLCLYMDFYRANGSLGARGEAILSLSGRLGGGVDHVKGVGRL